MFYPNTKVPKYKRGHFDTTGMCGHSQSEATKRKIGEGSKRHWRNLASRCKRVAKMARINRLPWKRKASAAAALNPNHGRRISATLISQYASGERQPTNGWKGFKSCWVRTRKAGEVYCSSSWEIERCKVLDKDKNVLSFSRNSLRIPYSLNGRSKTYFPDFIVVRRNGIFVEEVKGRVFAKEEWSKKQKAAKRYCKKNGMKFVILDSLLLVRRKET